MGAYTVGLVLWGGPADPRQWDLPSGAVFEGRYEAARAKLEEESLYTD